MRLTNTDSDSLIRALVPHYQETCGTTLPIARHGSGLLSLQTFILLLELGRERRSQGKPFVLAMEEPELHVPPGLQRRLVAQAVSIADQTVCTSHSPRVAAFYPATSVQLLEKRQTELAATPLLARQLDGNASNAARKLYHEDRSRVIEALMYRFALIPEGRTEYEWLRLLADVVETGDRALTLTGSRTPPFGAVVGVIPTHESAVIETFQRLRTVRTGLVPLVDGDAEGRDKVRRLAASNPAPEVVLQWREGWTTEDVIGWILKGDEIGAVADLNSRIDLPFDDVDRLIGLLKVKNGPERLKGNYLAYQEVGAVIGLHECCLERAERLLEAIALSCMSRHMECSMVERDSNQSTEHCLVLGFSP